MFNYQYVSFKAILLLAVVFVSSFVGCTSIGPKTIPLDRDSYNNIVLNTDNEQLLLNLVRIHYLEPPLFIKVGHITASYSFNSSISVNDSFSKSTNSSSLVEGAHDKSVMRAFGGNVDAGYADMPTISYAPLADREFTNAILAPVKLKEASLLIFNNSKEFTRLSRLLIQSFGEVSNAATATSADIEIAPEYKEFYSLINILNELSKKNGYELKMTNDYDHFKLIIHLKSNFIQSPLAKQFKSILKVPLHSQDIVLLQSNHLTAKNQVTVVTRSMLGVMTFLSHAVVSPPEDAKKGYLHQTYNEDGKVFNWDAIMNGLMKVHYSDGFPNDAYVRVKTHGYWFYIDNRDLSSKMTFTILAELFQLSSGMGQSDDAQTDPILTIPVR